MRILLIDDHALFRSGLKFLLSDLEESVIFIEAKTIAEATAFEHDLPDVILLDWKLPGPCGSEGVRLVREHFAAATLVVLSGEDDATLIRQAIDLGASGFIPKSSQPTIMINALRLILGGGVYLPPEVLSTIARTPAVDAPVTPNTFLGNDQLSERQNEVLLLAVKGKSNKQIARELNVSEGTVKQHLSIAFRILGVNNRTEAVYAVAKYNNPLLQRVV